MTFDWMDAWYRAFATGARRPHVLVVEQGDGTLLGVAPLVHSRRRNGWGGTYVSLRSAGSPVSDRWGVLCAAESERAVADAIARHLSATRGRWSTLDLDDVPDASPAVRALESTFAASHRVERSGAQPCPYLPIDQDWPTYLRGRTERFRKHLNQRRRRFEEDLGGRLVSLTDAGDVERAVEFFLDRQRQRRAGQDGGSIFDQPAARAFLRDVTRRLLMRGNLQVLQLEIGGAPAAVNLAIHFGGVQWGYGTAFDEAWKQAGLGTLALDYAIEHAFRRGDREVDLLRGASEWKLRWTSSLREQCRVHVADRVTATLLTAAGRRRRWCHHVLRRRGGGSTSGGGG